MADDKIGKETYIGKNDRPWPNLRLKRATITYHTTLLSGWIPGTTVLSEEGTLEGGLSFERLGIWTQRAEYDAHGWKIR